jgi:hypothetical protein
MNNQAKGHTKTRANKQRTNTRKALRTYTHAHAGQGGGNHDIVTLTTFSGQRKTISKKGEIGLLRFSVTVLPAIFTYKQLQTVINSYKQLT